MTICFLVPHREERENDDNPVEDVCDDRAICRGILPAEQSIEDTPSTAAIDLGITALCLVSNTSERSFHEERRTYVDVPNALADIVRAWS